MQRYNPKDIESKWQKIWEDQKVYQADLGSNKPKYIAMSMFNYPSGAGIHIGHAMNYTISDVKARFKRQSGYESYHPVGWDAFGLPAENYAIKAGVSPQQSMAKIIPDYHKQYKAMGWSNDWSKEISTHQPAYYKWTQWIFSEMYRAGLAYQDSRMQWWCEKCQTVLANEQVIDGKCWRHDAADDPLVQQKEVKQWFFKITEYAEELLDAIDDLDWTETVKLAQKNWIGKSVGVEIDFQVEHTPRKNYRTVPEITVFTTRPDTIFGATFLVIAPDYKWAHDLADESHAKAVDEYIYQSLRKTELERQENKDKTGVFTGAYAVNPINNEKIPIWIASYVLAGYGTGAIMAVPAHDERDKEFANEFNLRSLNVIKPIALSAEENSAELLELILNGQKVYSGEGKMRNSDKYDNISSQEAREKITIDLVKRGKAKEKINYKMRDWSVSRQRYWGAPIPLVYCKNDGVVLIPDEELPVILPELDDFKPSGDGRSALARAKDWLEVACPKCGDRAERETDTLDTYICSSWYMLRYFDPFNEDKIFEVDLVNKWMPIDFYNGGDHATAHMLYARFITRFFHKKGLVNNPEPFKQFLFNGKVTASDGSNFSKSKGNGVDPLEIIEQGYGADALRTYLMFAAPLEVWARWDSQGVPGAYRFLNRLWTIVQEYLETKQTALTAQFEKRLRYSSHEMIKKMTVDIETSRYNTAISAAMKCLNDLYKYKTEEFGRSKAWDEALISLVACVAPFAPHTADELWQNLGQRGSVQRNSWPKWDEKYLVEDTITIAVQVNGKLRAELQLSPDVTDVDAIAAAKADSKIQEHLAGKDIKKSIYVKGRLVSLVI